MKIAIVHEMLIKLGGAEKVVQKLLQIYPDADLYTLIYDQKKVGGVFPKTYGKGHQITSTSITQWIYDISFGIQRLCLPFMPQAVESLDLSKYDTVIVSSSGFAHGIITKPETKVVVYYHSPARYLWDWTNEYKRDIGWDKGVKGLVLGKIFKKLRVWDFLASQRKSIKLANSANVKKRIEKYYKQEAQIVYPPIEISRFQKDVGNEMFQEISKKYALNKKGYYIILGALTEFKKVDIAVTNFTHMPEHTLVIIGEGNLRKKLETIAQGHKNIIFTGAQYGDTLVSLVQNALGLIFPGEEDFGIVPIEAMGAGIPVFALRAGGLTETVIEGETGEFFNDADGKDFQEKFQIFAKKNTQGLYHPEKIKKHAQVFDESLFESKIKEIIEN